MNLPRVVVAVALTLLLVTGAVAAGAAALGFFSSESRAKISDPAVTDFVATGGECATGAPWFGVASRDTNGLSVTEITADFELSSPGYTVRYGGFERIDDGVYALSVSSEPTDKPAAQCLAHARYTATIEAPHDITIVVLHDGEEVGRAGSDGEGSTGTPTQTA